MKKELPGGSFSYGFFMVSESALSPARSLRAACAVDPTLNGAIPSTKGVL